LELARIISRLARIILGLARIFLELARIIWGLTRIFLGLARIILGIARIFLGLARVVVRRNLTVFPRIRGNPAAGGAGAGGLANIFRPVR
jgi:hypothetical protein